MKRTIFAACFLSLLLGVVWFVEGVQAQESAQQSFTTSFQPGSLKGISANGGFNVVVEKLAEPLQRLGLTHRQIKNNVELVLRRNGINPSEETSSGTLLVTVSGKSMKSTSLVVITVDTFFTQLVRLERDSSIVVGGAITWRIPSTFGYVATNIAKNTINETVNEQVREFANAFLTANPK